MTMLDLWTVSKLFEIEIGFEFVGVTFVGLLLLRPTGIS